MNSLRPRLKALELLFTVGLVLLAAGNGLAADSGQVLYEGRFEVSDLQWQADEFGIERPALPQTRALAQPGLPNLPVREIMLLVPMDREISDLWIEPLATHLENPGRDLPLAMPNLSDQGIEIPEATMQRRDGSFPAVWGAFTGSHIWRGYQLVSVAVYPLREIRQDDGSVRVEFLDSYAVRARSVVRSELPDHARRQRLVPGEAEANDEILRLMVANPEAVRGYQREDGQVVAGTKDFQPTAMPSLQGSGVSLLIVTSPGLASEFQRLADYKTSQGIPAAVVTTDFITANYRNGADIQETIRMFTREAYELWGVDYLLLGGDSDILPPRYVENTYYPTGGSTMIPADLYFACLDGNWNADADSKYGEPASILTTGDECDFAEEVYVGRAPVNDLAEAQIFVDKVIAYEGTSAGSQWTNRVLFAAEVLFPDDFHVQHYIDLDGAQFADQQVNDLIIPCTDMEYMRMYETDMLFPRDAPLTRAALIDTLNSAHYGIVNQIGHGYFFNMSVGDANFMTTDADALVNGNHLFLIYALNCASGAFDTSCLLERFIQNPDGGAVCAVGSARAAFPYNSNNYQQEFFDQLYCQGEFRVGRLQALSRLPFIGATTNNYVDRWTFLNYILLGDPSLPIWSGSPKTLALSKPSSLGLGPQTVTVGVTAGGSPAAGARVCLQMNGEDYAFGTTDGAGQVQLDFLPGRAGTAVLTVTGNDLARTTASIPVVAGTPYVTVSNMGIYDDGSLGSSGNGNGKLEAGETVALLPILQETGGGSLSGLTATLVPLSAGVTVVSGTVAFPNIAAGGYSTATTPFRVTLNPSLIDGETLRFQINISSNLGSTHDEWEKEVLAPRAEVVSLDWQDVSFGDGDGIIDDGEKLVLTVRLKNYGFGTADSISGVMRSQNANVALNDTTSAWADLELLDELAGTGSLSLTVASGALEAGGWIRFTDNYGRTFRHDFTLARPDAPTVINTDTSGGADVIALLWDPPLAEDVLGYHVYRSLSQGGPFVRVNKDLVTGTSYFRDAGLDLLTMYYYQIAAVDSSLVPSSMSAVIGRSTAPPHREGFPIGFGLETSSPLAVGDIDGDGDNEIVLASDEIYVWHHDGTELVDGDGNSQTLGPFTNLDSDFEPAAVALAELNHQPGLEIVASEQAQYLIHIYTKDGSELPGWPRSTAGLPGEDWNWAAPAVGDIDGDGEEEIVVNTLNGRTWAWNLDGTEVRDGDANPATQGVFYYRPGSDGEWCMSGPALYDLDGDGAKDVIFGTRYDGSGIKRLMAIKYDGTNVPGFPVTVNGAVGASPAIADLNNDGMVEIIFFTNWRIVYAIQQDGTFYPGFPKNSGIVADLAWVTSPGVGDMDGDGELEIVYLSNVSGLESRLVVIDTDVSGGTSGQFLPGWPIVLPGSSEGSPMIVDIDGDGAADIVQGIGGGDTNAPDAMYAFKGNGSLVPGFPIALDGPAMPSATICDLDGDWDVDLVYGGWGRKVRVWDMPFAYDPQNAYWPTYHGNNKRDGVYLPRALVDVPGGEVVAGRRFLMNPPFPNPFNPSTTVKFYVPKNSELAVKVYDVKGRLVRDLHDGPIGEGWHTLVWDGRDDRGSGSSSGVYFMRAITSEGASTHKITLVK